MTEAGALLLRVPVFIMLEAGFVGSSRDRDLISKARTG